mmetsp:Transcript_26148/g.26378  ORF Transcript_26148/g.26378 Transcript_26148/m.26378 type:complete len:272 (+) Transcript_26148:68-883(+)|eukprot:CAMPEP_0182428764 /NCGR_PEP_ID=MMETSP1167-20130531/23413_1 /TAXON_ID=2988 /ORGANISM="Mallomonas Sp, Strain CCMP3275" /LENGTH=271 /DNA_ID=CAMNT_0024611839 /DNA_START=65 /DNA_END=880 /DNA_ORIENTATION=+
MSLDQSAESGDQNNSSNNDDSSYLRTGKWTAEEEKYTAKLMESFLSGSLIFDRDDPPISLRTFLAQKLQCNPMRISKKYPVCYSLGVIYQQQVFSEEKLLSQQQQLLAYEKAYREKDIQTQYQRQKRKKYINKYKYDRNKSDSKNGISKESGATSNTVSKENTDEVFYSDITDSSTSSETDSSFQTTLSNISNESLSSLLYDTSNLSFKRQKKQNIKHIDQSMIMTPSTSEESTTEHDPMMLLASVAVAFEDKSPIRRVTLVSNDDDIPPL